MPLSIKIAWRNILRHKGKSFVIGIILFFGAVIMTIGNGVVTGMDKGIEENVINRFFGHMAIMSTNRESLSIFGDGMGRLETDVIDNYPKMKEMLVSDENIAEFIPAGIGFVMSLNESGLMDFSALMGVDYHEYLRIFNSNVIVLEGRSLKKGERGVLVTARRRKRTYNLQGFWTKPKGYPLIGSNLSAEAQSNRSILDVRDNVVFLGAGGESATDIRSDVKGIIKFKSLDAMIGDDLNLIDIESFRECMGYFLATDADVKLSKEDEMLLALGDDNFDFSVNEAVTTEKKFDFNTLKTRSKKSAHKADLDVGAYNFVFIKLKKGLDLNKEALRLNKMLSDAGLDGKAVPWNKASGSLGTMTLAIRAILTVFVLFVYFVAGIVIMNTLSMAAIERTNEIGMMRAVGAKKSFISKMFFSETMMLSAVAGFFGITIGYCIVVFLASLDIPATNEMVQLLYGGNTFNPFLGAGGILSSVFLLALFTLLAAIYPVIVARRITPLEAIARD
ncbi:ABC transporter permease [Spirochaetota bacterium]